MAYDRVIPFFSAAACLAVILPCGWHYRARNWTIIIIAAWLFICNFVSFVNALIWWNDNDIRAPVWCDISIRLTSAWVMGLPCAGLCLARRLEEIASTRIISSTKKDKRNRLIVDLLISVGIPLIYATLSIVYQGHRFDLIEGYGPSRPIYSSWPFVVFGILPPPIVTLISLGYSCLCLRHFIVRQAQFNAVLSSAGTNLNRSRYLRMMLLNFSEILLNFPVTIAVYALSVDGIKATWKPYTSWADVHYGYGEIVQIPASMYDEPEYHNYWVLLEISRWTAPFSAFLLFGFFGFNSDARKEYALWWSKLSSFVMKPFSKRNERKTEIIAQRNNVELPVLGSSEEVLEYKLQMEGSEQAPSLSYSARQTEPDAFDGVAIHVERSVK